MDNKTADSKMLKDLICVEIGSSGSKFNYADNILYEDISDDESFLDLLDEKEQKNISGSSPKRQTTVKMDTFVEKSVGGGSGDCSDNTNVMFVPKLEKTLEIATPIPLKKSAENMSVKDCVHVNLENAATLTFPCATSVASDNANSEIKDKGVLCGTVQAKWTPEESGLLQGIARCNSEVDQLTDKLKGAQKTPTSAHISNSLCKSSGRNFSNLPENNHSCSNDNSMLVSSDINNEGEDSATSENVVPNLPSSDTQNTNKVVSVANRRDRETNVTSETCHCGNNDILLNNMQSNMDKDLVSVVSGGPLVPSEHKTQLNEKNILDSAVLTNCNGVVKNVIVALEHQQNNVHSDKYSAAISCTSNRVLHSECSDDANLSNSDSFLSVPASVESTPILSEAQARKRRSVVEDASEEQKRRKLASEVTPDSKLVTKAVTNSNVNENYECNVVDISKDIVPEKENWDDCDCSLKYEGVDTCFKRQTSRLNSNCILSMENPQERKGCEIKMCSSNKHDVACAMQGEVTISVSNTCVPSSSIISSICTNSNPPLVNKVHCRNSEHKFSVDNVDTKYVRERTSLPNCSPSLEDSVCEESDSIKRMVMTQDSILHERLASTAVPHDNVHKSSSVFLDNNQSDCCESVLASKLSKTVEETLSCWDESSKKNVKEEARVSENCLFSGSSDATVNKNETEGVVTVEATLTETNSATKDGSVLQNKVTLSPARVEPNIEEELIVPVGEMKILGICATEIHTIPLNSVSSVEGNVEVLPALAKKDNFESKELLPPKEITKMVELSAKIIPKTIMPAFLEKRVEDILILSTKNNVETSGLPSVGKVSEVVVIPSSDENELVPLHANKNETVMPASFALQAKEAVVSSYVAKTQETIISNCADKNVGAESSTENALKAVMSSLTMDNIKRKISAITENADSLVPAFGDKSADKVILSCTEETSLAMAAPCIEETCTATIQGNTKTMMSHAKGTVDADTMLLQSEVSMMLPSQVTTKPVIACSKESLTVAALPSEDSTSKHTIPYIEEAIGDCIEDSERDLTGVSSNCIAEAAAVTDTENTSTGAVGNSSEYDVSMASPNISELFAGATGKTEIVNAKQTVAITTTLAPAGEVTSCEKKNTAEAVTVLSMKETATSLTSFPTTHTIAETAAKNVSVLSEAAALTAYTEGIVTKPCTLSIEKNETKFMHVTVEDTAAESFTRLTKKISLESSTRTVNNTVAGDCFIAAKKSAEFPRSVWKEQAEISPFSAEEIAVPTGTHSLRNNSVASTIPCADVATVTKNLTSVVASCAEQTSVVILSTVHGTHKASLQNLSNETAILSSTRMETSAATVPTTVIEMLTTVGAIKKDGTEAVPALVKKKETVPPLAREASTTVPPPLENDIVTVVVHPVTENAATAAVHHMEENAATSGHRVEENTSSSVLHVEENTAISVHHVGSSAATAALHPVERDASKISVHPVEENEAMADVHLVEGEAAVTKVNFVEEDAAIPVVNSVEKGTAITDVKSVEIDAAITDVHSVEEDAAITDVHPVEEDAAVSFLHPVDVAAETHLHPTEEDAAVACLHPLKQDSAATRLHPLKQDAAATCLHSVEEDAAATRLHSAEEDAAAACLHPVDEDIAAVRLLPGKEDAAGARLHPVEDDAVAACLHHVEEDIATVLVHLVEEDAATTDVLPLEEVAATISVHPVEEHAAIKDVHHVEDVAIKDVHPVEEHAVVTDAHPVKEHTAMTDAHPVEEYAAMTDVHPVEEHSEIKDVLPVEEHVAMTDVHPVEEHAAMTNLHHVEEHAAIKGVHHVEQHAAVKDVLPVEDHTTVTDVHLAEESAVYTDTHPVEEDTAYTDTHPVEEDGVTACVHPVEEDAATSVLDVEENAAIVAEHSVNVDNAATASVAPLDGYTSKADTVPFLDVESAKTAGVPLLGENAANTSTVDDASSLEGGASKCGVHALDVNESTANGLPPLNEAAVLSGVSRVDGDAATVAVVLPVDGNTVTKVENLLERNAVAADVLSVEEDAVAAKVFSVEEDAVAAKVFSVEEDAVAANVLSVEKDIVALNASPMKDNSPSVALPPLEGGAASETVPSVEGAELSLALSPVEGYTKPAVVSQVEKVAVAADLPAVKEEAAKKNLPSTEETSSTASVLGNLSSCEEKIISMKQETSLIRDIDTLPIKENAKTLNLVENIISTVEEQSVIVPEEYSTLVMPKQKNFPPIENANTNMLNCGDHTDTLSEEATSLSEEPVFSEEPVITVLFPDDESLEVVTFPEKESAASDSLPGKVFNEDSHSGSSISEAPTTKVSCSVLASPKDTLSVSEATSSKGLVSATSSSSLKSGARLVLVEEICISDSDQGCLSDTEQVCSIDLEQNYVSNSEPKRLSTEERTCVGVKKCDDLMEEGWLLKKRKLSDTDLESDGSVHPRNNKGKPITSGKCDLENKLLSDNPQCQVLLNEAKTSSTVQNDKMKLPSEAISAVVASTNSNTSSVFESIQTNSHLKIHKGEKSKSEGLELSVKENSSDPGSCSTTISDKAIANYDLGKRGNERNVDNESGNVSSLGSKRRLSNCHPGESKKIKIGKVKKVENVMDSRKRTNGSFSLREEQSELRNGNMKSSLIKKKLCSLLSKKPKSNLDLAIERVATNCSPEAPDLLPSKKQEVLSYVGQFDRENLYKLNARNFDKYVLLKTCQGFLHHSDFGVLRKECDKCCACCEEFEKKNFSLQKQVRDLLTVVQKLKSDLLNKNPRNVAPIKVTRSVGLQVQIQSHISHSRPPEVRTQSKFISKKRMRELECKGLRKKSIRILNSVRSTSMTFTTTVVSTKKSMVQQSPTKSSPPKPPSQSLAKKPMESSTPVTPANVRTPIKNPEVPTPKTSQSPAKPPEKQVTVPVTVSTSSQVQTSRSSSFVSKTAQNTTKTGNVIDLTDEEDKKNNRSITQVTSSSMSTTVHTPTIRVVQPHQLQGTPQKVTPITSTVRSPVSSTVLNKHGVPLSAVVLKSNSAVPPIPAQQSGAGGGAAAAVVAAAAPGTVYQPSNSIVTPPVQAHSQIRVATLKSLKSLLFDHPAPLPPTPVYQSINASRKLPPPKPNLKLSKVTNKDQQGIVLSWNMSLTVEHEQVASYQLYAYQEGKEKPSTDLWKKVGDVKALPLPMACTLTQFMDGHKYYFAVRAVDIFTRTGQFSDPSGIVLNRK